MQQVIHPETHQLITAEQYIQQYPNAMIDDKSYKPPLMICPHCGNRNMTLRARSSIAVPSHFVHPRDFGFCPSQENREGIYRGTRIQHPDLNNARHLKDDFRRHWKTYFKKIKELVPYLRKEEFTKLLDIANEERIWEYQNIEPYHIPYLLVTLADFPIQRADQYHKPEYCRKLYFRYWFNSQHNNYEQIIAHIGRLSLCRASYQLEGKERMPRPERLMKIKDFPIHNDLRQQDINDISESIERWVNRYFELRRWAA